MKRICLIRSLIVILTGFLLLASLGFSYGLDYDDDYDDPDDTIDGVIYIPVSGVSLNYGSLDMDKGDTTLLRATVKPKNASNKNVYWSSSNNSVASVSQNGLVTARNSGGAVITVTTDYGNYSAECDVYVRNGKIDVTGVSLDINWARLDKGDTLDLKATVTPKDADNKNVTWSSSDNSVAIVNSKGRVTARKSGFATIMVSTEDGYPPYTDTCSILVEGGSPVTGVRLNRTELTMYAGNEYDLIATVQPADASNPEVYWYSSNDRIVSVDDGTLYAHKAGNATITVTTVDGGYSARCQVQVTNEPTHVTGVSISPEYLYLNVNETRTLSATVRPKTASNKNVSWTSSNSRIATVNANGRVTAISNGTAIITVKTDDGGHTADCEVTVNKNIAVKSVSLNTKKLTLRADSSYHLQATINPSNATNKEVTWKSNNSSVASVNNSGKVTAKKFGTATITVTTKDGGHTDTCKITVLNKGTPVTDVSLNYEEAHLQVNDSLKLIPTIKPNHATNQDVSWKSSDTRIATVNANGKVTAQRRGTAYITVTTDDGGHTATCKVIVSDYIPVTGVTLKNSSVELDVGETCILTATVKPSDATNDNVSWSSSNMNIAEVNSHGWVTAKKAGACNITVTTEDGGYPATCQVYVNKSKDIVDVTGVTLDHPQITLEINQYFDLQAFVTPSDATVKAVDWVSSNPEIASIDPYGRVIAKQTGTAIITAYTVDGDYEATCRVTVSASPQIDLFSIASSWAIDQLYAADEYGLVPEHMKGSDFTQPINRAEFAAIGVLLYQNCSGNQAQAGSASFNDISDNVYADDILKAYNTGIVSGTGDGNFLPAQGVNRESAATMMTNVCKSIYGEMPDIVPSNIFADDQKIDQWAKKPVYLMNEMGVIKGVGDNKFDPFGATTREQALIIAKLLYEKL